METGQLNASHDPQQQKVLRFLEALPARDLGEPRWPHEADIERMQGASEEELMGLLDSADYSTKIAAGAHLAAIW